MKKILKIISEEVNASEFVNIEPAKNFIPEWYRLSSSTIDGTRTELFKTSPRVTTGTYKKCSPFYDAMTSGYIAFLTSDIEISKNQDETQTVSYRTNRIIVTEHDLGQVKGIPVPNGYSPIVLKWHNQFTISTPKEYSLLFTNPINRFDLPFYTITGVVDTDNYNLPIHYPFFIKKDFSGIIEKGTPIAQIIPIKRDNWSRELEEYNMEKSNAKYDKYFSTIKRSYKNNFWVKKEYN